jgi:acyl-CoA synthetase (AMP-forming)/AMP-acid ligase II
VKGDVTPQELTEFLGGRLAKFKIPSVMTVSDKALAKNATGKLLKKTIREEFLETTTG